MIQLIKCYCREIFRDIYASRIRLENKGNNGKKNKKV